MTQKENRLSIRANPDQKSALTRAARARHMNLSQFVLQASLSEAKRVIQDETQVEVTPEEYEWLCQAMDAAPGAAPRLREAMARKAVWDE